MGSAGRGGGGKERHRGGITTTSDRVVRKGLTAKAAFEGRSGERVGAGHRLCGAREFQT